MGTRIQRDRLRSTRENEDESNDPDVTTSSQEKPRKRHVSEKMKQALKDGREVWNRKRRMYCDLLDESITARPF